MFRQIRYQTGEALDIINDMKNGIIPCMDVDDIGEFDWFANHLSGYGIYKVSDFEYDKNARDRVNEPEFEFRAAFYTKPVKLAEVNKEDLLYIDVYFEPDIEETYDSIFGD